MWICARTQYRSEAEAERHLLRKGITTFLPRYQFRSPGGHTSTRLAFPSYIFAQIADPHEWPRVERTVGVERVLTHAAQAGEYRLPSTTASEAIEALRLLALATPSQPQSLITAGCYVRVMNGPLAGNPATERALVLWANNERAKLLVSMFQRDTQVEFFVKDLALHYPPN